ncbi:MAG: SPOR domain-containing protein [Alphaproteobacteria bacterium]|nr:SPOR domain-containing protein [Alphaproteobacteria bacterium]
MMAQPLPQPRMSIEEAQLQSAAAQEALAMREFRPQPAVINAPMPVSVTPAVMEDNTRREFVPASLQAGRTMRDANPGVMLSAGDRNVIQRFDALNKLRDAELITGEEYQKRRMANLGAMLPYSKPLPGLGLDRPVPSADAIIARIAALGRSLEMRAITPRQHQLERGMILNALLPEAPATKATRRPPPNDFLEAAGMVGKLELLRAQSLISDEEFDAESDAIEKYMNSGSFPGDKASAEPRRRAAPAMEANPAAPAKAAEPPQPVVSGPVVHLASYSSEEQALKGWQDAQTRSAGVLGPLMPLVRKIDLGEKQGVFYRLMAGPFPDLAAAELACIEMKKTGQFCRATDSNS